MEKNRRLGITREQIEQLNESEPHCFETDREEQWYNVGLQEGLRIADANPKLSFINVEDSLPEQDEEVIVLCDEFNTSYFYKISFAHIVDKTVCKDYNGWNVPDVVYWFPMPKIPKTGD